MLMPLMMIAQEVTLLKQKAFPKTVSAGNYSGITWLGASRYAIANDKSPTAGFYLMTIETDSITGELLTVREDTFLTSGLPNRDEEGICYMPESQTVFVSGEADQEIIEYNLQGQLTGRKLNIPEVFKTSYKNGGFEALCDCRVLATTCSPRNNTGMRATRQSSRNTRDAALWGSVG